MNTTIDDNSHYFPVPFAVADIKYNILGTPFFEDNIQNINIQDFTLEFKYQSKTHPNYAKFTTLLSKDYPYFSYIYRTNSKTEIRVKPKSFKIAHFPIPKDHNLHFTTTPQNHFFPSVPHTYFATKFRTNFNFIISLKYSQMTNQTFQNTSVQPLFRTPPNMFQHYLQNLLDILKLQLQMKNLNSSKSMIFTL